MGSFTETAAGEFCFVMRHPYSADLSDIGTLLSATGPLSLSASAIGDFLRIPSIHQDSKSSFL
jgi:hypothetical protein